MKTIALAGGSGVIGSRALQNLLASPEVERVVALGRRPLAIDHPKLVSKVADLQSPAAMARELPEKVDVAVCALGTTMKRAGSKEAFRAVDRDAVIAFAKAARDRGARRFVLVSSIGASPGASSFYLKTKGEAEDAVAALGFEQVTVLRPSFIDDEGTRTEHRLGERLALPVARAFFSVVGKTNKYAPISADVLGRAVARLALDEAPNGLRTLESDRLHAIGA